MTYRELTRNLMKLDREFSRQGKCDHETWRDTRTIRTSPINWGSRDLKPGTLAKILSNPRISKRDFDNV